MQIGVALVHAQQLFREALAHALGGARDLRVIGTGSGLADARALGGDAAVDVLVVDDALAPCDGIGARARVLVLGGREGVHAATDAYVGGARGYALKADHLADLLDGVRVVAGGGTYLSPSLPRDVLAAARRRVLAGGRGDGPLAALSQRERQVFRLAVGGTTNQAMADALGISVKTIERHRAHLNKKLDAHSPADLVRFAAAQGLLA